MRKTGLFFITALLLFVLGCGGAEKATTSEATTGGVDTALPAGFGLINLTIRQTDTAAPVEGPRTLAPSGPLPAADTVRIAARLVRTITVDVLDDNGNPTGETVEATTEIYRKIVDASLPAGTVSIPVPAADNYVVEVLSSRNAIVGADNVHILLRYGRTTTPVNVLAGENTTATIAANPIADGLTITLPDNVIAGSSFTFPVAISGIPLRGNFFINQFVDNVANSTPPTVFVFDNSARLPQFTAQTLTTLPTGASFWSLYFQGLFFIDPSWQSDAERFNTNWYRKFVFYYPNRLAGWTDPYLTTPLYPLGTVNIEVTLSPLR